MTAVLFDLDGVLVDSRRAIAGSLNHALRANGLAEHPEPELYRFIGPSLASVFAALSGQAIESELVVACVASYREHYREASLRLTTVVPGIPEVMAQLAQGHRLAVATSKPIAFAVPILESLGLRHFFAAVAGPDLNPFGETKTVTIASALEAVGERAVMVGDRHHDVDGARANGLPCIGVLWGIGNAAELRTAGAAALAETPDDLIGIVAQLAS
jgi:phosphoglycolate phosphatase